MKNRFIIDNRYVRFEFEPTAFWFGLTWQTEKMCGIRPNLGILLGFFSLTVWF